MVTFSVPRGAGAGVVQQQLRALLLVSIALSNGAGADAWGSSQVHLARPWVAPAKRRLVGFPESAGGGAVEAQPRMSAACGRPWLDPGGRGEWVAVAVGGDGSLCVWFAPRGL